MFGESLGALCEAHEAAGGGRGKAVIADFRTTAKAGFHLPWVILPHLLSWPCFTQVLALFLGYPTCH